MSHAGAKEKRLPLKKMVLRAIAGAGIISVTLLAPKMTRLFKSLDRAKASREGLYKRISQAVTRLEANGLIVVSHKQGKRSVSLTEQGKILLDNIEFEEYVVPEQTFWDGKWRVLMFDMSERRRPARDKLRRLLQGRGFVRLQDSVWVYPYPCDGFIALVRSHLKSGIGELRFLTADALESDAPLRTHFKL